MFMKKSQLKAIVKEIVRTYENMTQGGDMTSWTVEGSTLFVEDLALPDGKSISAEIDVYGHADDGAFDHEFGTHRYPSQFTIEEWKIVKVWDTETQQLIPLTNDIKTAIDTYVNSVLDKVADEIGED